MNASNKKAEQSNPGDPELNIEDLPVEDSSNESDEEIKGGRTGGGGGAGKVAMQDISF